MKCRCGGTMSQPFSQSKPTLWRCENCGDLRWTLALAPAALVESNRAYLQAIVEAEEDRQAQTTDLQTQLEDLLDCIWKCEANWRFDDRLDVAMHQRSVSR